MKNLTRTLMSPFLASFLGFAGASAVQPGSLGPKPALAGPERAEARPLTTLPAAKLTQLAPLLRSADLVLLESDSNGAMKQITAMTLAAARPDVVREVLMHPERYTDFVRNMKRSDVQQRPDGTLDHSYALDYSVFDISGTHRYVRTNEPGGPVELFDADPNSSGLRHYRWEFLPVGSGTLVVQYGYTDLANSGGVIEQLRQRFNTLEYGMALVAQMSLLVAMKSRAEQVAGPAGSASLPAAGGADYGFLLDRGTVAMLRNGGSRLSDLSLVDRTTARPEVVVQVAKQVDQWAQFVPSIKRSESIGDRVDMKQALPLLTFDTQYGVQSNASSVELYGLAGDLRGARLRFDVRSEPAGSAARSQLVFRASQQFDRASFVIRQLYKMEPLFEYGINIGLAMLMQRGVRWRAEQQSATLASAPRVQ